MGGFTPKPFREKIKSRCLWFHLFNFDSLFVSFLHLYRALKIEVHIYGIYLTTSLVRATG